ARDPRVDQADPLRLGARQEGTERASRDEERGEEDQPPPQRAMGRLGASVLAHRLPDHEEPRAHVDYADRGEEPPPQPPAAPFRNHRRSSASLERAPPGASRAAATSPPPPAIWK